MAKKRRKLKKQFVKLIKVIVLIILFIILCEVLSSFITKKTFKLVEIHNNDYFTNSDFGIVTLTSIYDYDNDGVDDYTDILNGAKKYASFNPKYISKYYAGGYPPVKKEGVCTDLIWYSLKEAGYNLKEMIILDIKKDQEDGNKRYDIKYRDDNIDFRRVGSQKVFFDSYAEKLPSGLDDLISYQPGDIVVFDGTEHIAMISDKRNKNAIPYLIQNGDEEQEEKEEDVLEETPMKITGHYRFTFNRDIKNLMNKVKES